MFDLKKLLLLGIMAPVINLFISGSAIAHPSAVVDSYYFSGSYKLTNTRANQHVADLHAGFKKPEINFFDSCIQVSSDSPAMVYKFKMPHNATAQATLYFSGTFIPGNLHISAGVYCKANVSISNNMLTLNNPVCTAGSTKSTYNFKMTFNGKSTAVLSLKAIKFPQLDISYIAS